MHHKIKDEALKLSQKPAVYYWQRKCCVAQIADRWCSLVEQVTVETTSNPECVALYMVLQTITEKRQSIFKINNM